MDVSSIPQNKKYDILLDFFCNMLSFIKVSSKLHNLEGCRAVCSCQFSYVKPSRNNIMRIYCLLTCLMLISCSSVVYAIDNADYLYYVPGQDFNENDRLDSSGYIKQNANLESVTVSGGAVNALAFNEHLYSGVKIKK